MKDASIFFKNKTADIKKLEAFGFGAQAGGMAYHADLMSGDFGLTVLVTADNRILTEIIDTATNEPYLLLQISGASGTFIGKLRTEYDAILQKIADECFDNCVFTNPLTQKIIKFIADKYQDTPEYLWEKFPENAIFRRKDTAKWYAALLRVSRRKLGFDSDDPIDIIDLRVKSENLPELVDGQRVFPGYHMNKRHWITVCLDGSLPSADIFAYIDESYQLAKK